MTGLLPKSAVVRHATHRGFSAPRVAIVHYWLVSMRGGERVLERLLNLFPEADIFTHVHDPSRISDTLNKAVAKTSFINRLPFSKRVYPYYLPLMPMALEHLDLGAYDLVISSEAGPAKGIITRPDSLHVCYCHSPMRYLWDQYHQYRQDSSGLARLAMPAIYHRLRQWDVSSSARVDKFAANSRFIRDRINKVWRRESEVIHPPVSVNLFTPSTQIDDNYLWVGQFVPYKRPDLAVKAFNANGLPLLMVGTGSMEKSLRAMAGPNIKFVKRMDFTELRAAYARCKALVMTAEEDFGITPVEAMASGRPVVAFGRGGVMDSVKAGETGVFFSSQEPDSLIVAIDEMESFLEHFDPRDAVAHAQSFVPEIFDEKIRLLTQTA